MDSDLVKSLLSDTEQAHEQKSQPFLKLLVFGIGKLNLALPIEFVSKIIDKIPVYSSGLNYMSVAHLGDHEIVVIDLYKRLFKTSITDETAKYTYLVIARNNRGEELGIPLTQTPNLLSVPLDRIRALPESYRRSDTLEIASHVAVIPEQATSMTIFLIDVDVLLS